MKNKIYNPFTKEFWTKENMFNMEAYEKAKKELEEHKNNKDTIDKKMSNIGDKMVSLGKKLTLGLTLPIILTVILGPLGLIIGIIIFFAIFFGGNKT